MIVRSVSILFIYFASITFFFPYFFGIKKIVGDTVYNLIKVNDYEVDDNDVPLYPPKVVTAEVLYNPFDDLFPRLSKKKPKEEKKPRIKRKLKK